MSRFITLLSATTLGIVFFYANPNDTTFDEVKNEIVKVDPVPVKTALIEIQTADWCAPCRRFKASGIIKELKAQGWDIKYVSNLGKCYPTFRVWVDGESKTWSGYGSKSSFYRTLKANMKKLK